MPHLQKNKSPMELAEIYLAGTPYMGLIGLPVPFRIPDEVRFEHCHIVSGTEHGIPCSFTTSRSLRGQSAR